MKTCLECGAEIYDEEECPVCGSTHFSREIEEDEEQRYAENLRIEEGYIIFDVYEGDFLVESDVSLPFNDGDDIEEIIDAYLN